MAKLDRHLDNAVQQLKAASADVTPPVFQNPTKDRRVRPAVVAVAAFIVTLIAVIPVAGLLRSNQPLSPGTPPTTASVVPTTALAPTTQVPATTQVPTVTTTVPFVSVPLACGATMPFAVVLPTDFSGPLDGPAPDTPFPAEDGQLVIHWIGRDGSVELRWPPNATHTENAVWGSRPSGKGDTTFLAEDRWRLATDDDADLGVFVSASAFLPTEQAEGPCDVVQLEVYKSNSDAGLPATRMTHGTSYQDGPGTLDSSGRPQAIIYPGLPRARDLQLVVETIEIQADVNTIAPVVPCDGGQPNRPPKNTKTIDGGPFFDTPQLALEALLDTADAESWPKTGYFELIEPDGSITYGNPLDDLSANPGIDAGLVISISVTPTDNGWTVDSWETSGC